MTGVMAAVTVRLVSCAEKATQATEQALNCLLFRSLKKLSEYELEFLFENIFWKEVHSVDNSKRTTPASMHAGNFYVGPPPDGSAIQT